MTQQIKPYLSVVYCLLQVGFIACRLHHISTPEVRQISFSGCFIFKWLAVKLPSITMLLVYNQLQQRGQWINRIYKSLLTPIGHFPSHQGGLHLAEDMQAEDSQVSWCAGLLCIMSIPCLYICNNISPNPRYTHQFPIPVLDID